MRANPRLARRIYDGGDFGIEELGGDNNPR
jgi:hypothetical protein